MECRATTIEAIGLLEWYEVGFTPSTTFPRRRKRDDLLRKCSALSVSSNGRRRASRSIRINWSMRTRNRIELAAFWFSRNVGSGRAAPDLKTAQAKSRKSPPLLSLGKHTSHTPPRSHDESLKRFARSTSPNRIAGDEVASRGQISTATSAASAMRRMARDLGRDASSLRRAFASCAGNNAMPGHVLRGLHGEAAFEIALVSLLDVSGFLA